MIPKILVIEDEASMREVLRFLLENEGYHVDTVSSGDDAVEPLKSDEYDIVICDIRLPGKDGFSLLEYKKTFSLKASYIMITSYGSVESAVEAIKKGADEYITKPFLNDDLLLTVRRIIKYRKIERENEVLRKEVEQKFTFFNNIIGKSKEMQQIFDIIRRIAKYDSSVLISGPSGTGKELIAKSVHFNSPRKNSPFVPINCGAIPEGLLESELFGYVKGSFTGAQHDKKGLFEQAEGGTVFLDEISEMAVNLQVKLLRVLQEKEIRRLGDVTPRKINVRIIASTNKDLEDEVRKGNFREDLYYRLNVVEIKLPPLSKRREDIPLLVDHFINKFNKKFGKNIKGIEKDALEKLMNYPWPGNVRELEHTIERAVALNDRDIITKKSICEKICDNKSLLNIQIPENNFNLKDILRQAKEDIEKLLIKKALEATGNNRTKAAKLLGISHRSLIYKINDYEL
ncbi:MAG: sigma-54-dependent Fis family transcriptional regulator [Firmicutes bacterium]|jgi:DNA-binding NtrC family response regulator|nr:sigma-54-dependent Fis family transcriptional regulator [Bacillota bacterium]